jgi:cation:H+ antiporter
MAAGLAMLYYGASWLVGGSVGIARRLGISQLVIGMTIVAYGTSTPELVVSVNSALKGLPDISLGNVVGSNIANIGLILGLSAIVSPLLVKRSVVRKEIPIMIGTSLILVPLSFDGKISEFEGVMLVSMLVVFSFYSYRQVKKESVTNYEAQLNGAGKTVFQDSS